ncbi:MAG TPA: 3'-5' exoribonuclease [Candidatus Saccharimonadales bacterium]|nr:3'-5' exoribonuclease [Candidatus Saccharimonadales bacterium]
MLDDNQIYIVVDIEGDGPVPGLYSMLSLGAVASTADEEVGSFYRKLMPLLDAGQYPPTMDWWQSQPDAWHEATTNAQPARLVMQEFNEWVRSFDKVPVFVAQPVGYDYTYVSWYLWKFAEENPFTDHGGASITLDLASFISGKFGRTLQGSRRSRLPSWLRQGMPEHSHNALDDARGFGVILRHALRRSSQL